MAHQWYVKVCVGETPADVVKFEARIGDANAEYKPFWRWIRGETDAAYPVPATHGGSAEKVEIRIGTETKGGPAGAAAHVCIIVDDNDVLRCKKNWDWDGKNEVDNTGEEHAEINGDDQACQCGNDVIR